MEKLIDLRDLLKHEILDLYSAEEQIIDALPAMIEKANNTALKTALSEHLKITESHKQRLDDIRSHMSAAESNEREKETSGDGEGQDKKPGFFSRLFGGGSQKCRGMEGLIIEGNKMMGEDMSPEVLDAAIIASAQKIEHYEICGYGTARAFARELQLSDIANKLTETLNEEYTADDKLTQLAVGKLNIEAEFAEDTESGKKGRELRTSAPKDKSQDSGNGQEGYKKQPAKKAAAKQAPVESVPNKTAKPQSLKSRGASSSKNKSTSVTPSKAAAKKIIPSKAAAKKVALKTQAAKKTVSKTVAFKKASPKKAALKKSSSKKVAFKKVVATSGRGNKAPLKKVAAKKNSGLRRR